jgi:hypothetical protein
MERLAWARLILKFSQYSSPTVRQISARFFQTAQPGSDAKMTFLGDFSHRSSAPKDDRKRGAGRAAFFQNEYGFNERRSE